MGEFAPTFGAKQAACRLDGLGEWPFIDDSGRVARKMDNKIAKFAETNQIGKTDIGRLAIFVPAINCRSLHFVQTKWEVWED